MAAAAALLSVVGCGGGADMNDGAGGNVETGSESLVNGTPAWTNPAIGRLLPSGCGGTLISSRVVLTAAHCFDSGKPQSGLAVGNTPPQYHGFENGTFTVSTASRTFPSHEVLRVALLGGLGPNDLAVVELGSDVDPSEARPLDVARSYPAKGDPAIVYGYGCTSKSWDTTTHDWRYGVAGRPKSAIVFSWQGNEAIAPTAPSKVDVGCNQDSGGPVLNAANQIVGVVSYSDVRYNPSNGNLNSSITRLADPIANFSWIDRMNAVYGRAHKCSSCPSVSFQALSGNYLSADQGGGGSLYTRFPWVQSWETFKAVSLVQQGSPGYFFALQASNGQFISAEQGGGGVAVANRDLPREWETLQVPAINNGASFGSITTPNGASYLSWQDGGDATFAYVGDANENWGINVF